MADEEKKVQEAEQPATEQVEVERVGDSAKAEAEAINALPKVDEASVPKAAKTGRKPSKGKGKAKAEDVAEANA